MIIALDFTHRFCGRAEASNGEEALAKVEGHHPDLVITDILMPQMDGYEFLKRVRLNPDLAYVQVILYTATYQKQEIEALFTAGRIEHYYLAKPSEPEEIIRKVDEVLSCQTDSKLSRPAAAAEPQFDQMHSKLLSTRIINQTQELESTNKRLTELNCDLERFALFNLALEAAPNAMIMTDKNGAIVFMNQQVENLFGYKKEELFGKSVEILVPDRFKKDHPRYRAEFAANLRPRAKRAGRDLYGLRKDGSEVPIEIGLAQVSAPDGVFVISAIVDLTERKRAEQKIITTVDELARSNADLEQFAYVASHDLQEPLRAITSNCQALEERYRGRIDSDDLEYLELAVNGAKRMQLLVEGLLEYSRVDRGQSEIEEFDGNSAVEEVMQNLQSQIKEIHAEVTSDRLPRVSGNKLLFGQVLQNLVGNALKFRSEKSNPHIHIGAKYDQERTVFFVRDNGIGIDPKQFERIFIIFQRLHGRNKYLGTGLGLAICKKIVERYGGSIWVESEPDKGATFYFTMERGRKMPTLSSVGQHERE